MGTPVPASDLPSNFVPANDLPDPAVASATGESVMDPHPIKTLGKKIIQNTATMGAGAAPIAAGAKMGTELGAATSEVTGPAGPIVGGVLGAGVGALAAPAAQYLMSKGIGVDAPKPTLSSAGKTAVNAMELEMGFPSIAATAEPLVEGVLGIRGAGQMIRDARAKAPEQAQELEAQQGQIRSDISSSEVAASRKTIADHADAISKAESDVDAARMKLRQNIQKDVEAARPAAAAQVGEGQARGMIGKSPKQFQQESARPYEQRAAALSRANSPYFDAASAFHKEVGEKFNPYIEPIKNTEIPTAVEQKLNETMTGIDQTLEQRGQRVESAELKKVIDGLRYKEPEIIDPFARPTKTDLGRKLDMSNPQQAALAKRIAAEMPSEAGEEGVPNTFGKLWGLRARAGRVLASAKNPADRAAANEVIGAINDAIPGVPQELRSQYSFERKMNRSVIGGVASARTPQEVGDAIFGSKAKPLPAEIPLQAIRFTKKYNPEGMDGLRQAFADHYIGNNMSAGDLGKMNPAVLKELYGSNADSVVRLLGPEGELKQASWGQLIKTDPAAADMLKSSIRDSMLKQTNIAQRQAIQDGERTVAELGPKYQNIASRVESASTPEAKLKILSQELPTPDKLAQAELEKGMKPGRIEGYIGRRLIFMGMLSALGGYGHLSKRPELVEASLVIGGGLLVRGAARYALTTEGGASTYMKALDMFPSRQSVGAFGKVVAPLIASGITQQSSQE